MGFLGLDIVTIRHLARQLETQAGEVASASTELGQALDATSWFGADQSEFLRAWESEHRPALFRAAELLRTASVIAAQGATDQERASRA